MGEYAEMMLDGTLCQVCGVFMGHQPPGFPLTCRGCESPAHRSPAVEKVKCPTCGKRVKAVGLADHQRDVHVACGVSEEPKA